MRRTTRAWVLLGILALLIAGRVVAGRHLHETTTTVTTPSTTTTSTTVPASTSTSTSTSTTSSTVASLTTCRGTDFTGQNLGSSGAAGSGVDVISLTKVTAGTCVVDGYPVVALVGSGGVVHGFSYVHSTQFPTAPANEGPARDTVADGSRVDLEILYNDVGASGACPSVTGAQVALVAGDTPISVTFAAALTPCTTTPLGVSAMFAG